ncbi:MAG: glycosyltransferase family 4 protein [Acidimicrobiia bacterium]
MSLTIGMIAPISHPFPPPGYGPWERVCHDLTEGLVQLGHDVVVFAPAGSNTSGDLHPTVPMPLVEAAVNDVPHDSRVWESAHIAAAVAESMRRRVDVVHSHLHVHALGYAPLMPMPLVTTLHGAAWDANHHMMLDAHRDQPFVSLSDAERRFLPDLNYVATVNNGIRLADYPPAADPGTDLAFVGRMAPEKAPHLAIAVANSAGLRLVLAGAIEAQHQSYFDDSVRPQLGPMIRYVGELPRHEVVQLLSASGALIMPLLWDEPFGLVVIESLAVGTPVVAWRRGAMPELIRHGETGFLVDDVQGAAAAVATITQIDRARCRVAAETRFGHIDMARGYVEAYGRAIAQLISARTSDTGTVATEIQVSETP